MILRQELRQRNEDGQNQDGRVDPLEGARSGLDVLGAQMDLFWVGGVLIVLEDGVRDGLDQRVVPEDVVLFGLFVLLVAGLSGKSGPTSWVSAGVAGELGWLLGKGAHRRKAPGRGQTTPAG